LRLLSFFFSYSIFFYSLFVSDPLSIDPAFFLSNPCSSFTAVKSGFELETAGESFLFLAFEDSFALYYLFLQFSLILRFE
jgi:hypothetical protein